MQICPSFIVDKQELNNRCRLIVIDFKIMIKDSSETNVYCYCSEKETGLIFYIQNNALSVHNCKQP